jgi:hypothetical protein
MRLQAHTREVEAVRTSARVVGGALEGEGRGVTLVEEVPFTVAVVVLPLPLPPLPLLPGTTGTHPRVLLHCAVVVSHTRHWGLESTRGQV